MTRSSATTERCPDCASRTTRWLGYFCPDCGQHHDALYLAEAPDSRPRRRDEIAREYRIVGMDEEADRLASEPDDRTPIEIPEPSTEPTARVQRSLLGLLESA